MKFSAMYLDIVTGSPEAALDRYAAPIDGRTCNHVVKADLDGRLVAAWYTVQADMENLGVFSLIDVLPYRAARDQHLFDSPEAEAMYPDGLDQLFILRVSGYHGQEPGLGMTLKINLLYE